MKKHPLVIVGAGQGGAEIATAARHNRYDGPIVLIGEEPHLPYQRPPLSKAYLAGRVQADALRMKPAAAYESAGIEVRTGLRVESIDRARRTVRLSNAEVLHYEQLALATGGRARQLECSGVDPARVGNLHTVRTLHDVDRLREQFVAGRSMVIIGGGYIGLEVASVAIASGLKVTVLESQSRVLARVTAPVVSDFYEQVHRAAGVALHTDVNIAGMHCNGSADIVTAVRCTDRATGRAFTAETDLVIVGIGMLPNTELAQQAGLAVDNGIVVDEFTRTSDPDIYAAGDCTNHPSLIFGRRVRLESVPNALEQGRATGATVCGIERPYAAVPWFWSDQYDLKLQMVGLAQGHDQVVIRGSIADRTFAAFYLRGGRLIAVDAINRIKDFMAAKRLVAQGILATADQLADESLDLKSLEPCATSAHPASV